MKRSQQRRSALENEITAGIASRGLTETTGDFVIESKGRFVMDDHPLHKTTNPAGRAFLEFMVQEQDDPFERAMVAAKLRHLMTLRVRALERVGMKPGDEALWTLVGNRILKEMLTPFIEHDPDITMERITLDPIWYANYAGHVVNSGMMATSGRFEPNACTAMFIRGKTTRIHFRANLPDTIRDLQAITVGRMIDFPGMSDETRTAREDLFTDEAKDGATQLRISIDTPLMRLGDPPAHDGAGPVSEIITITDRWIELMKSPGI